MPKGSFILKLVPRPFLCDAIYSNLNSHRQPSSKFKLWISAPCSRPILLTRAPMPTPNSKGVGLGESQKSGICRQSGSLRRGILEKPGFSITLDVLAEVSRKTGLPIRIIQNQGLAHSIKVSKQVLVQLPNGPGVN
jgi:hypothetical protein